MKVLMINVADAGGGAAVSSMRLLDALESLGVQVRMLVGTKSTSDPRTASSPRYTRTENLIGKVTRRLGMNHVQHIGSFSISDHPWYREADVVNFHNLHMNYFSYLAIDNLTRAKPGVFTLHDMWPFTGHCFHSLDCERWKTGCGNCPHLDTYPAMERDFSAGEWRWKNATYKRSRLSVVAPSKWLADKAKDSMLGQFSVHEISNGVPTDIYTPLDRETCRRALDLPLDKKILLTGAQLFSYPMKGAKELSGALRALPEPLRAECHVAVLGAGGEEFIDSCGIAGTDLGYVESDPLKASIYNAADLFVSGSRVESQGMMLMESMACGVPCVALDATAIPDTVKAGVTGELAPVDDTAALSAAIRGLLENDERRRAMRDDCVRVARAEFDLKMVAKKYIEVFEETLDRYAK